MAKVLGVGGVFFKAQDPKALGEWYHRWLGIPLEGTMASFLRDDLPAAAKTVWSPFAATTRYFQPSAKEFMINFMVDDLTAALAQVREGGGQVVGNVEEYDYGRFGWFVDPDGNKIELWEVRAKA